MDQKDKIIIALLARIVGYLEGVPADDVVRDVEEKTKPKEKKSYEPDPAIVERIYKLYPTRCPITKRSLGKGKKNKEKIATLLKKHTPQEIEAAIRKYIDDSTEHNVYFKNFSTLLNNLPDIEADPTLEEQLRAQGYR